MKVLAISSHPDDETLGCGGTLLKHRFSGDSIFWLITTRAAGKQWSDETRTQKEDEIRQVAEAYHMKKIFRLDFPAAGLDTLPLADLMEPIRNAISQVKPDIVYLVHKGDVHTDHIITHTAVMSVLKPFYMNHLGVRRILSYETLSSTEAAPPRPDSVFLPNVFTDITQYIEKKIKLMELYKTETHSDPMPRGRGAIRALARYRGATIGIEHAEAFMLIREVIL